MCRSIHPLFNFDPPATDSEIRAASLQFIRKVTGFTRPSRANVAAFDSAVEGVSETVRQLLATMSTAAPVRDQATEADKARARSRERYA